MSKKRLKYSILNKKIKNEIALIIVLYAVAIIMSIEAYIVRNLLTENGETLKTSQIEGIDKENFENSKTGTTYYVSANGISNDGTDINNPMSLETANRKNFNSTDKVLLKCGDVFFGQINFNVTKVEKALFYIGNYGEGELPKINGSKIINKKDAWKKLDEYDDIYVIDLSDTNNFEGLQNTDENSFNIGFIADSRGNQYGNRKQSLDLLDEELSFYCDKEKLYVKCSDNPNIKMGDLKLSTRIDLIKLNSYTELEGIKVEYTSAHGIVKKSYPIGNIYIHNCIIENIGGSVTSESSFIRYGNGIEFYGAASNIQIENNIIRNVYDAGFTIQGTSEEWNNIIVKNNILIKNCYSFELWGSVDSTGMNNVQIYNNICVNEGKGFGQKVRPNPYNSAEYVFYSYGENANMDINMYNNSYINTTRMYYIYYTIKERFKQNIKADNNKMYWGKDTIYVNDLEKVSSKDFSYLYDEYNVEQNSELHLLTEQQLEKINNEQILNSDDYNEIKTYYENLTNAIDASTKITELQSKYETLQETYSSVIQANTNIKQKINSITTKLNNIETDSALLSTNIEELLNLNYEIGTIAISNKTSNLNEFLIAINEIGNEYTEILKNISIANNNSTEVTSEKITELSNKIDQNGDLQNIELIKSIYQIISTDYNAYSENQDNLGIKLGKSIQISNLLEWSNKILELDIEYYIANAKIEISYSNTELTNQDVTATLVTSANIQVTNNSNSKEHLFTDNGSFDFQYNIKGQAKEIRATVNNIDKNQPIISNVENNRLYINSITPQVSDKNLQKVELYKDSNLVENYKQNTAIIEDGFYKIVALDRAGNETYVEFYISRKPVDITYSETVLTNKDVTATLTSNFDFEVNNNSHQKKYTFTENGTFDFDYTVKGCNLTLTATVNNIDKEPPSITGVENGKTYISKVKPIINDKNLKEVKLYQNESLVENYQSGNEIVEEGLYKIVATDTVGNQTNIEFEITTNLSEEYKMQDSYILNIKYNTDKSQFDEKVNTATKYEILRNGQIISNQDKIATGDVLKTENGESYTLIVNGDINKDGNINIYDLNKLRICILTNDFNLDEEQKLAADSNLDGQKLGIRDLVKIKALILTKDVEE